MGIRISQLPETQTINFNSDVLPIVQGNVTKKILLDYVKHPDLVSVFNNNKGLTANWDSVYSNVHVNSSVNWNYQGTDIKALTGKYSSVYTTVNLNSSVDWNYQGTDIKGLTGNWDSVYTTVNLNSSVDWNYQGTDIKGLTGNWDSVYTTVNLNSSTYSTYDYVNNNFLALSGGTVTANITAMGNIYAGNAILTNATIQTFTNPATASGQFLILDINGTNKAIRLWDFTF
jgi:hypothetical protein